MNIDNDSRLEVMQARRLVRWLTGSDGKLISTPDAPGRQTRPGGHPDAVVQDVSGNCYAVEVGRLLLPAIRNIEAFAKRRIAASLEGKLPGTFTLTIDISNQTRGKLDLGEAATVVGEVNQLLRAGSLRDSQTLGCGFTLARVLPQGSRLVPLIVGPSIAHNITEDDSSVAALKDFFDLQVEEADSKLRGWQGNRILLMDIGQSGLDWEFHAQKFKGGQGILITWAEIKCPNTQNLDFVFLEPGVHVWQVSTSSGEGPQIYAGTKWVDQPRGFYPRLWRRLGHPQLGRFGY